MLPLTDSMQFFPDVSLPTQINQARKMSNHYNLSLFVSQKLQLFSKAMKHTASFTHFQVNCNNILIRNQWGKSSQN